MSKQRYSTNKLNNELMPIANDIKTKMDFLGEKYNFNLDFAFKEIKTEEITGKVEKD
jgi:hypothetical protein